MMGDMVVYRPRCCKCKGISTGRICYAGNGDSVVDNPFCGKHFGEIFKKTQLLIQNVHKGQSTADYIFIQHFFESMSLPPAPRTIAELLSKGTRIYSNE